MKFEWFDYQIKIRTGEVIRISEVNYNRIEDSEYKEFLKSNHEVFQSCIVTTEEVMEKAKIGDDSDFIKVMKAPPFIMLGRYSSIKCRERKTCLSWNSKDCTSNGRRYLRKTELVPCWSYPGNQIESDFISWIFRAWYEGRHVVIITSSLTVLSFARECHRSYLLFQYLF